MALNSYIEDDWNDNALTGRTDPVKDVFYEYGTGGTGDLLKGVYRPRWETDVGSPSATNGVLEINGGDGVKTPSEHTVGSISYDVTITSTSLDLGAVSFMAEVSGSVSTESSGEWSGNCYWVRHDTDNGLFRLEDKTGSEVLISESTTATSYSVEVTRDSYGGFELFRDGTSKGTATDTTNTSGDLITVGGRSDLDTLTVGNLIVQ